MCKYSFQFRTSGIGRDRERFRLLAIAFLPFTERGKVLPKRVDGPELGP